MNERYQILTGDCLAVMRELPPLSVDLVVCSPPYEAARLYAECQFKLRGQDWVDWCVPRFMECVRVCKGLVVWVVEGQTREFQWSAAPALLMADLHRAGAKLRKPPVYARVGIPGSVGPDWWRNDYEFCICASHGKLPWSDNTACGHPPKWAPGGDMSHRISSGTRVNQWGKNGSPRGMGNKKADGTIDKKFRPSHRAHTKSRADGTDEIQHYAPPAKANPGNVLRVTVGGGQMGSPLSHENEAPFPESLVEKFVLSFCPPGGTVLDIFGGSGTTVSVALKNGRNAISIDVRESQVELMHRGAAEAMAFVKPATARSTRKTKTGEATLFAEATP